MPVILFQGLEDQVVPPDQAEAIVELGPRFARVLGEMRLVQVTESIVALGAGECLRSAAERLREHVCAYEQWRFLLRCQSLTSTRTDTCGTRNHRWASLALRSISALV